MSRLSSYLRRVLKLPGEMSRLPARTQSIEDSRHVTFAPTHGEQPHVHHPSVFTTTHTGQVSPSPTPPTSPGFSSPWFLPLHHPLGLCIYSTIMQAVMQVIASHCFAGLEGYRLSTCSIRRLREKGSFLGFPLFPYPPLAILQIYYDCS